MSLLQKYCMNLQKAGRFVPMNTAGTYAIQDCTKNGTLIKTWVILETLHFRADSLQAPSSRASLINTPGESHVADMFHASLLICSCRQSANHRIKLESLSATIKEDMGKFQEKECSLYCIHAQAVQMIDGVRFKEELNADLDVILNKSDDIEILSMQPFVVAVFEDRTYGIIVAGQSKFKCQTCCTSKCVHLQNFHVWNKANNVYDINGPSETKLSFRTISHKPIPWPLTTEFVNRLVDIKDNGRGKHLKTERVTSVCEHGNTFKEVVLCDDATIHQEDWAKNGYVIYAHRTDSGCCEVPYDGSGDLLLNIDNKHLFEWQWLFRLMKSSREAQFPIQAHLRTVIGAREDLGMDGRSKATTYYQLHKAYNAFTRLLDWSSSAEFSCKKCETMLEAGDKVIMICDGICMGCRRDLLHNKYPEASPANDKPIIGSRHEDRVLLTAPARKLLALYTGMVKNKLIPRYEDVPCMQEAAYQQLLLKLKTQCLPLHNWIKRMGPKPCDSARSLLAALSSTSSLCGSFQITDSPDVFSLLKDICKGSLDITDSTNMDSLVRLQKVVPILAEVIVSNTADGVSGEFLEVIGAITDNLALHHDQYSIPCNDQYSSIFDDPLEFYPNFPKTLGKGIYRACTSSEAKSRCRKKTESHATLLPGIFTVFCEHEICQGFSLMREVESPRTPFDIFLSRFNHILDQLVIVYDNCCNLQEFAMNREPARFMNTTFLVDRLHFRDHTACTLGYSLDMYKGNMRYNILNSQANEQANASLRNLSKQVTFMCPEQVMHHTALFLVQRNRQKKKVHDI